MKRTYTLLEWNIHKMTKDIPVEKFVIKRILIGHPDIIILVEYKRDTLIEDALINDYFYDVSIGAKGNDVLVAIKKSIVLEDLEVNFDKNFFMADIGKDQPTVLAGSFFTKDREKFTVVGLRYVQGGNGLKVSQYLKQYLDEIPHAFMCAGDFNILEYRMPIHFKEYYHESYKGDKDGASVVMLVDFRDCIVKGYNRLDHIIYNSFINRINLNYVWDFTQLSKVYIPYDELNVGDVWKIPAAYPDHAILEGKFSLI